MKKNNNVFKILLVIIAIIIMGLIVILAKEGLKKTSDNTYETKSENGYSFLTDLSMSGRIVLEDNTPVFISDKKYNVQIEGEEYEEVNQFSMVYDTINEYAEAQVIVCGESIFKNKGQLCIEPQFFVTEEDICIPTPFCVFHYPAEWADYLRITKKSENDKYVVKFSAVEEDKEIDLYNIIFFESESNVIGKIVDNNDGVIPVSIQIEEVKKEDLSTEQSEYIYSMLDAVNYVIENLNKEDNFSSEI